MLPQHIYIQFLNAYADVANISNQLIRAEKALHTWLDIYSALNNFNFYDLSEWLQKFDEFVPEPARYINAKGKPVSLRNLIVGFRQNAAPLCILALTEDFDDDDMFDVHEIINKNGPRTISLSCLNNNGERMFLHAVPFRLMARSFLMQFCPKMFPTPDKWASTIHPGEIVDIGRDSVTSWHKAYGSLDDYDKHRREVLKSLTKKNLIKQTFIAGST